MTALIHESRDIPIIHALAAIPRINPCLRKELVATQETDDEFIAYGDLLINRSQGN